MSYDINLEDLPPQLSPILDDYRDNIYYSVSNNIVNPKPILGIIIDPNQTLHSKKNDLECPINVVFQIAQN